MSMTVESQTTTPRATQDSGVTGTDSSQPPSDAERRRAGNRMIVYAVRFLAPDPSTGNRVYYFTWRNSLSTSRLEKAQLYSTPKQARQAITKRGIGVNSVEIVEVQLELGRSFAP